MEAALRVVKLIALAVMAFIGYRLLVLTMQPHEAIVSATVQLSFPFSLEMALQYKEWMFLIGIALVSAVCMLRASIFDPLAKLIALVLLGFIGYRLLVLAMLPREAVVSAVVQLSKLVPSSLEMALQYKEWTVLVGIALVSVVCMLRAAIFDPLVK